jgi:maleamate amidohydrolase
MNIPEKYLQMAKFYSEIGPNPRRVGYGETPAVLVIDMNKAFTQPGTIYSINLDSQIETIARILLVARRKKYPIFFSTNSYDAQLKEAGAWHMKYPQDTFTEGSDGVKIDPRLDRRPDESLLIKKYASCFFGTDLASRLISQKIDTLIIGGCSTSGCVRTTVVDAISYGFRPIVVAEAVGDRAEPPHIASLSDIDRKYGDVVSIEEALNYLEQLKGR